MSVPIKDFLREALKAGALFPSVFMLGTHLKDEGGRGTSIN